MFACQCKLLLTSSSCVVTHKLRIPLEHVVLQQRLSQRVAAHQRHLQAAVGQPGRHPQPQRAAGMRRAQAASPRDLAQGRAPVGEVELVLRVVVEAEVVLPEGDVPVDRYRLRRRQRDEPVEPDVPPRLAPVGVRAPQAQRRGPQADGAVVRLQLCQRALGAYGRKRVADVGRRDRRLQAVADAHGEHAGRRLVVAVSCALALDARDARPEETRQGIHGRHPVDGRARRGFLQLREFFRRELPHGETPRLWLLSDGRQVSHHDRCCFLLGFLCGRRVAG